MYYFTIGPQLPVDKEQIKHKQERENGYLM